MLTLKELQTKADELIAQNQALGTQIDAIREQRRNLLDGVRKLHGQMALARAVEADPTILDAIAPGAVVEVSGAEMLQAMAQATAKGRP